MSEAEYLRLKYKITLRRKTLLFALDEIWKLVREDASHER